jgi:hypothetical protein
MTRRAGLLLTLLTAGALAGCAGAPAQYAFLGSPPSRDALLAPRQVMPGHLEYAEEPDAYAPLLAQRRAYPTQVQANDAYQRFLASAVRAAGNSLVVAPSAPISTDRDVVRVRLFACRPGILNDTTGRIEPARGHQVHCATDFLDAQDRRLFREIVNFSYERGAWRMAVMAPPKTAAPWINPEPSPKDFFSWASWGRRTTPY